MGMLGSIDAGVAALEQAIAELRALSDADPDRLCGAIEQRVRLAAHVGDTAGAHEWLERLQAADPDAPPTRACWPGNVELRRAAVAFDAGSFAQAHASLQRAGVLFERAAAVAPLLVAEQAVLYALVLRSIADPAAAAAAARAEAQLANQYMLPPALRKRAAAMRAIAAVATRQP
jgi:hypothetical protein